MTTSSQILATIGVFHRTKCRPLTGASRIPFAIFDAPFKGATNRAAECVKFSFEEKFFLAEVIHFIAEVILFFAEENLTTFEDGVGGLCEMQKIAVMFYEFFA